tara:strand:+ start:3035 stop:4828 length:1794 start_codon:yes stop_codon:yes gene_type:complete
MSIKKPAINYTSREFVTIKNDLVNYARRYYPERFRDFSVNSFGSLMLDSVAYVGDILSFYLDYQVNETFLSTALQYDNVLKIAQQMGYKPQLAPSSYGLLTCFVLVPSTNGTPNWDYAPILKRGSKFRTTSGRLFTLMEDISFKDQEKVEAVVGNVNTTTGVPSTFALRSVGQAVSGELAIARVALGDYERFRTIEVPGQNITEIVSVTDSEGNFYYEVDHLTQNTVYLPLINRGDDRDTVTNILKPIATPRRFTTIVEKGKVKVQFGFGSNTDVEKTLDPNNVFIKQHGKNYVSDTSIDPASLMKTDKLGIVPSNTTLTIVYRVNSSLSTNAGINTITVPADVIFEFQSESSLNATLVTNVRKSIESTNESPFVGSAPLPSSDEIKQRALGAYSMQNRMVTKEDFIAAVYNMPSKYGAIKKVNVLQDSDSFQQRNINLYVISVDNVGLLAKANNTIKNNLKTYLMRYKMINDSIDILDANIINLKIDFKVASFDNANKYAALESAKQTLSTWLTNRGDYEIGEPFSVTDVFAVLKASPSVLDVISVDIGVKSGGDYADSNFSVTSNKTADGRKIICPSDSIFEVKYKNADIIGTVV